MNLSVLKEIGLSDKEIKVFVCLLESGSSSVRGLADFTGLNRGSVYDILKKLQEEGLVTYFQQDTKQRFAAEDPERLSVLLEKRKKDLDILDRRIKEIIPELKSMQDKGGQKPSTKFFEGVPGVRAILKDVISSFEGVDGGEREYYVYSAKKSSEDWKKAYPEFTEERIKKMIKVKAISLAKGGKTSGLDERKWLGSDDESATFIILFNDKCAFLSRDAHGNPFGVIIENRMIYQTQKLLFMRLWQLL